MPYYRRVLVLCSFFVIIFMGYACAVTPPYLDKSKVRISVAPAESYYGDIVIENPSPNTRSMRVYLQDWYYVAGGDGSKEFPPPNTTPLSCAAWISFSPAEFTLSPFGRQRVSYAVKVPSQAKGGYYAVLFFESAMGEITPTEQGVGAGLSLAIRVGALFYVEAKGTIKRTADIENLSLSRDNASHPLSVQLNFHNTGNVDITAGGSFYIMDKAGIVYARGEFNNVYTFPGESAKFNATWKESIPKGKYDLVITIDIGKALEEVGLGRGPLITKEAQIEIGDNGGVVRVGELK